MKKGSFRGGTYFLEAASFLCKRSLLIPSDEGAVIMHRNNQMLLGYKSLIRISFLVLLLGFVCVACGTNVGSGPPTSASPTPASPTPVSTTGCPNPTVVTTQPPAANVVLSTSNNNSIVSVNKGDTVEVDLPFGHRWEEVSATPVSQNLLTEQTLSGYALSSSHMCVWRFVATNTGTAHLTFVGQPICAKGEPCPLYLITLAFAINIK
jgi:hypothetical protein